MRILVCGGRDFDDYACLADALSNLPVRPDTIIHGGARGADALAAIWAKARHVAVEEYPADWRTHGHAAGPLRNRRMLEEGRPDVVVAFPGGKGTRDMMRQARAAGVQVIEVK
jgi:hypothetical protein